MIKKLLTIVAIGSFAIVNAQTSRLSVNANNQNGSLMSAASASGCIQITTQTSNSVTLNTSLPCNTVTNAFGGYVNGKNCYGDLEKANYFALSTFSSVTSPTITNVAVGFFKNATLGTKGTVNTVTMNIYNGTMASGPTGGALASVSASLSQIVAAWTNTTNSFFTYTFTLASPIVAPAAGFFASVTVPQTAGDTIVIFNQTGATANFGWEKQTPSSWVDMGSAAGWGVNYKASLSIYPIVCGSNIISGISKNLGLSKNIQIMPNPSTGLVNLAVTLTNSQDLSVTVTNALGQVIVNNKYTSVLTDVIALDLTNQSSGVYFVTVSNGQDKMVQRLILNK